MGVSFPRGFRGDVGMGREFGSLSGSSREASDGHKERKFTIAGLFCDAKSEESVKQGKQRWSRGTFEDQRKSPRVKECSLSQKTPIGQAARETPKIRQT